MEKRVIFGRLSATIVYNGKLRKSVLEGITIVGKPELYKNGCHCLNYRDRPLLDQRKVSKICHICIHKLIKTI